MKHSLLLLAALALPAVGYTQLSGKLDEALAAARQAADRDQQALDAANKTGDRKQTAAARDRLAESLAAFARALEKAGKLDEHLQTLVRLADVEHQRGQPARAEQLRRKHLQITEEKFGADVSKVAASLEGLSFQLFRQNRAAESLELLHRSLKLLEAKFGADDVQVARALYGIGAVNLLTNRFAEAETALQRCLKIREAKLDADHLDTAWALLDLGRLYRNMGQYARAVPFFRQAVRIRETKLGADHLDVAWALNDLANAMQSAGQFRDAVPMHERTLKIREAKLPPNHPDIAASLNNLAVAHWNSGVYNRHQRALEYLERSLKINEANLGPDHPDIATALVNIATILDMTWRQYQAKNLFNQPVEEMIQKREKEREGLYKRALKILETHRGPGDAQVAVCLDRFGNMLLADGSFEQAEPHFRRCLKIRETQLPFTHPDVIETLETLIRIHALRAQWDKVADLLDDVNRRMRLHVRHNLPSLSTPQQLAFLQRTHEAAFHRCLTLPFLRPDDPALIARAAEWVLNGKAVAQEARAEQAALLLDSKDPQAPQLAQQLLKVRAEMEQCRRFSPGSTQEEDKKRKLRLTQLEEQESLLVAKLNVSRTGVKQNDAWVKLADVRARIPANAVLIEIVDFDLWDFKKHDWKSIPRDDAKLKTMTETEKALSRYVAWIIPPVGKGDVRFVDLGDSWKLREAVENYQKVMKGALRQIQIDEQDAEKALAKSLQAIADQCLKPLEKQAGGAAHWILGLDSHLWLVPWAALPLSDGKYMLEKYTLSYVTTGRDVLSVPAKTKLGPALVLGDPNFALSADEVRQEAVKEMPKGGLLVRGATGAETARVPRDWQRLPGTAEEIKQITPALTKFLGGEMRIFTGNQAVETLVKAARSPRLLVLATHGFTLPPPPMPLPMADGATIKAGRKIQMRIDGLAPIETIGDPMLRCGMVFAGANKRDANADPAADDGILTGVEVLGCDLRGTELVVLSACETGLGDVNLGEGVAGLRQAFQSAGAQSVVASLWKVSDKEAGKLMAAFWNNLAAGQPKADALRQAQLSLLRERRKTENAAHPFFWAAFTLTGDWR